MPNQIDGRRLIKRDKDLQQTYCIVFSGPVLCQLEAGNTQ